MREITTPLNDRTIEVLEAGDEVFLNGIIYTARDQAHLRLAGLLEDKKDIPVPLQDQVFYYCGPTPAKDDMVIGSCGPTTSGRMDKMTPLLLENGLKGMIGKGARSAEVIESIKRNKAVYFIAPAGAGAYLSQKVLASSIAAFKDLGPEAVYRLEVRKFPVIVCVDSKGNNIYK
jgi:fumarate hydratase subunit beta